MQNKINTIGIVVIGRNEGDKLVHCFSSLRAKMPENVVGVVYSDSASSDKSLEHAQSYGFETISHCDSETPSAARARNNGFSKLVDWCPDIKYVQFIDGDCALEAQWLQSAHTYLEENERVAVVRGHCVERFPEKTIYHRLCDVEWREEVGEVTQTGGIFMVRADLFASLKGFDQAMPAGEEPEFCYRLSKQGWRLRCIDFPMVTHDADILSLAQWTKRIMRSGYAYAQGYDMYRGSDERYYARELYSILFWAAGLPLFVLLAIYFLGASGSFLLFVFPAKILQITFREKGELGYSLSFANAVSLIIGKFPQLAGAITYWLKRER